MDQHGSGHQAGPWQGVWNRAVVALPSACGRERSGGGARRHRVRPTDLSAAGVSGQLLRCRAAHCQTPPRAAVDPPPGVVVRAAAPEDQAEIIAFDRPRSGFAVRRSSPIFAPIAQFAHVARRRAGDLAGFVLGRDGMAPGISGPWWPRMRQRRWRCQRRRRCTSAAVDRRHPDRHRRLKDWLAAAGATAPRRFTRMLRGHRGQIGMLSVCLPWQARSSASAATGTGSWPRGQRHTCRGSSVLRRGTVLPAHPLALDRQRGFDRVSQRALARYYIDAGAGGLAVGVHATQFRIREAGLLPTGPGTGRRDGPGLDATAALADRWGDRQHRRGACGGAACPCARLPRRPVGLCRPARCQRG